MRRALTWTSAAVVACLVLAAAGPRLAHGNGRRPGTVKLHFRPGDERDIMLAATIGALRSTDGGASWRWYCEAAVGYGGKYDPDYAFNAAGAIFATTFDGLTVNRDGCRFVPTSLGDTFVSQVTVSPNGDVLAATADAGNLSAMPPEPPDSRLYRSSDDGVTFTELANPGMPQDWWESLEVAPSDPQRLYLTGYRFIAAGPKVVLLFRSVDGGSTFTALPISDFALTALSDVSIVAIAPDDPDLVLARVSFWQEDTVGDALYRSTDGGLSWTKVLELADLITGVVVRRAGGEVLVATRGTGWHRSTNRGQTFTAGPAGPPAQCLSELSTGELWVCSNNYPDDFMAIGKGTDGVSWTRVMQLEDLLGPVRCEDGTVQKDECEDQLWCGLDRQLGIAGTEIDCVTPDAGGPAPPDARGPAPKDPTCCGAGTTPGGVGLLVTAVALVLGRRRPGRPRRR
ncbi:MAG: hypothetical protein KBG28_19475 [Kofleriaceae bacterium]|jgi:photosystem II stability/assembly factor-like uncharacterized protein|nr:hypothetical protein [Kofleriaceae bacterium]